MSEGPSEGTNLLAFKNINQYNTAGTSQVSREGKGDETSELHRCQISKQCVKLRAWSSFTYIGKVLKNL